MANKYYYTDYYTVCLKKENGMKELKETVEMMNSKDYKERFKAEYWQTYIRYKKLTDMIDKWEKGELNFVPTCKKGIYKTQLLHMANYLSILRTRAKIEKVDLGIEEENE